MSRNLETASKLWRVAPWVLAALLCSTSGLAGVNTWTGGSPGDARYATTARLIASDPSDPYVVYAVFGREYSGSWLSANSGDLHRSVDGGRTWTRIVSVGNVWIQSLLVYPTVPTTVLLGAVDATTKYPRILKSTDRGLTWSRSAGLPGIGVGVRAFAATPTEPPTFLAATSEGTMYRSVDGGDSWSTVSFGIGVANAIAFFVVDPKNEATIYAGAEDGAYGWYGYSFGAFSKSADSGATWTQLPPDLFGGGVSAIAIDPEASTLFVGLQNSTDRVLRSSDGGASWASASAGLPPGALVSSLVVDAGSPATLYAGTDFGVYRTRDAGASWSPFGQLLSGASVLDLSLAGNGRLLHAGTFYGAFDMELGAGPIDVSSGPTGESRVLFWEADRLSVRRIDASGGETGSPFEGPYSAWTATAIAEGADGRSRVLWQNGDGRVALQIVGPTGGEEVFRFTGPQGFTASDISVGADGEARLLWTSANGAMFLSSVDSAGHATPGPQYGPYGGWAAVAISDGSTWVLWRNMDGRACVSSHTAGRMGKVFRWGSNPGWAAEDIAVGADGRLRLLWTNPDGRMEISTVDASGQRVARQTYASPGLQPRRIAAGADGLTRVLWSAPDGGGAVWLLHSDNSLASQHPTARTDPNPPGNAVAPIQDTSAFSTRP